MSSTVNLKVGTIMQAAIAAARESISNKLIEEINKASSDAELKDALINQLTIVRKGEIDIKRVDNRPIKHTPSTNNTYVSRPFKVPLNPVKVHRTNLTVKAMPELVYKKFAVKIANKAGYKDDFSNAFHFFNKTAKSDYIYEAIRELYENGFQQKDIDSLVQESEQEVEQEA
jgi:hypothetical protein